MTPDSSAPERTTDDGDSGVSRRWFVATLGAATSLMNLTPSTRAQLLPSGSTTPENRWSVSTTTQAPTIGEGPVVGIERIVSGLTAPVGFETANESSDRRFLVDQVGKIYIHTSDGLESDPFLDISDKLVTLRSGFDERGLLGLAFHPDFSTNRKFYVRYSAPPDEATPDDYDHRFILSEFKATSDGSTADPESERVLLDIQEPQFNHNAGPIVFGPDGYLYIGVGDGGNANDIGTGHVTDWYETNDGGNGQDVTENLLGSILRIDVDTQENGDPYGIPDDNPLVGTTGLDEHYAWGFRNPWGMSFDSQSRLFVADAGQNLYEEVNLVSKGGNYGWNIKEGTHCFSTDTPSDPPDTCPDTTPDDVRGGELLIDPIIEYPHTADGEAVGTVVVGGFMYENSTIAALNGAYVFGDWSRSFTTPDGRLFAARPPTNDGLWSIEELRVAGVRNGKLDRYVLGFGQDDAGDLYVLTSQTGGPTGTTGEVYKLTSPTTTETIELGGEVAGWMGRTPAGIDGETNPTLEFAAGEFYEVRWTNLDGVIHDFQILDSGGNVLVETASASQQDQSQTVEFLATKEMTKYRCSFHPTSMRGETSIGPGDVMGNGQPATDPDDDSKFEDITGDGSANILDVGALLERRNSDAIQRNIDAFDFTGDGRVNILDVGKLLQQVL